MTVKLISYICLLVLAAGCVSIKAQTWHQGQEDEYPTAHSVGLDTSELVQRDRASGSIDY